MANLNVAEAGVEVGRRGKLPQKRNIFMSRSVVVSWVTTES